MQLDEMCLFVNSNLTNFKFRSVLMKKKPGKIKRRRTCPGADRTGALDPELGLVFALGAGAYPAACLGAGPRAGADRARTSDLIRPVILRSRRIPFRIHKQRNLVGLRASHYLPLFQYTVKNVPSRWDFSKRTRQIQAGLRSRSTLTPLFLY